MNCTKSISIFFINFEKHRPTSGDLGVYSMHVYIVQHMCWDWLILVLYSKSVMKNITINLMYSDV